MGSRPAEGARVQRRRVDLAAAVLRAAGFAGVAFLTPPFLAAALGLSWIDGAAAGCSAAKPGKKAVGMVQSPAAMGCAAPARAGAWAARLRVGAFLAGGRGAGPQAPYRAPARRGLDLLEAGDAVQLGLVLLLDAKLADVVGAAVIGGILAVLDGRLLGRVDAADVAEHMAADLAEGVAAEQARLQIHAR